MDKAILVIDMPDNCRECTLCDEDHITYRDYCRITNNYILAMEKPEWCPLKPAPKKVKVMYGDDSQDWDKGYNSCVEEIVGE